MKTSLLARLFPIALFFLFSCSATKYSITPTMEIRKHLKSTGSTSKTDAFLAKLLQAYPQYFDTLLANQNTWQIQVIYTQIDRNEKNLPAFKHFYYNVNHSGYYYPASTVKLPTAVLALQKLNELNIKGVDRNTTMITEAEYPGQTRVYNDPTSSDGRPTISNYIKKILLVSDNDAFNRLYEFLGQEYLNNNLAKMGYDQTQIIHRLNISLNEEQNRHTNPVYFADTSGQIIYQQPLIRSNLAYQKRTNLLGVGYYNGNKLIQQPFDFSMKNRLTLPDLHSIVQSVLFPNAVPKKQLFELKADDYQFLYKYMSMYPRESAFPSFDSYQNDTYVKFLLYGAKDPVNPNIRIFNKVGDAYGFLIDAAYIVDFESHIEFILSAVIHCNPDGIYNDDKYEYDKVGLPFMKHLGEVIYKYEKTRARKHLPDLTSFKMNYGQ